MIDHRDLSLEFPLFLPATRLDRLDKASASGASSVIIDLEDAVAPDDKPGARTALTSKVLGAATVPHFVRVNAYGTPWYEEDIAAVLATNAQGIVLPKTESPALVEKLRKQLPQEITLFGLIESAVGMGNVRSLAPLFERLFFGSLDYAADLGCAHTNVGLAAAKSEIILAARLAGRPGPCDGVTPNTRDPQVVKSEASHGVEIGFRGKLLIHPMQVAPAIAAYLPDATQRDWAQRVVEASAAGGVVVVDGAMVDAPVVAHALQILKMSGRQDV